MRSSPNVPLLVVTLLGLTPLARAGVYSTDFPLPLPTSDYRIFRETWSNLRTIPIRKDQSPTGQESPLRLAYLAKVEQLEERRRMGLLTAGDRVNLGEAYIRLGEFDRAVLVLTPAARESPPSFMALANLATAHQLAGRLDRAVLYLRQTQEAWPSAWPGWTSRRLQWYQRVERYQLRLVEARLLEQRSSRSAGTLEHVDPLFPDVSFEGPGGEYLAGSLPGEPAEPLPDDAVPLVEQLLFWLPNDARLQWLLGEVLNAGGFVAEAAGLLDNLVYNEGFNSRTVRRHRQELIAGRDMARWLASPEGSETLPLLMWGLHPRGGTWLPGVDRACAETGSLISLTLASGKNLTTPVAETEPTATTADPRKWNITLQHLFVSFGAGCFVGILLLWQLRQFTRKRGPRQVGSRPGAPT